MRDWCTRYDPLAHTEVLRRTAAGRGVQTMGQREGIVRRGRGGVAGRAEVLVGGEMERDALGFIAQAAADVRVAAICQVHHVIAGPGAGTQRFYVEGHCWYATALHGRCRGQVSFLHKAARCSKAL